MKKSEQTHRALRQNAMTRHLLESLEAGKDIGHYGRLVFAMVARHFMSADDLANLLANGQGLDGVQARALVHQVESRGYNPPRREKIMQWQKEQEFPICPGGDDPDACNLYRNLPFPDDVYQKIEEYHEAKVESGT